MLSERRDTAGPPLDEQSLDDWIEAALTQYHVVDPRRFEEVERMREEMRGLAELGDRGGAERLAKLCIEYIRAGQVSKE